MIFGSSQLLYEFGEYPTYAEALHAAALAAIAGEPMGRPDAVSRLLGVLLAVVSVVVFATLAVTLGAYFLDSARRPTQSNEAQQRWPDAAGVWCRQGAVLGAGATVTSSKAPCWGYISTLSVMSPARENERDTSRA